MRTTLQKIKGRLSWAFGFTKKHPRSHYKKANKRVWWAKGGLPMYGRYK